MDIYIKKSNNDKIIKRYNIMSLQKDVNSLEDIISIQKKTIKHQTALIKNLENSKNIQFLTYQNLEKKYHEKVHQCKKIQNKSELINKDIIIEKKDITIERLQSQIDNLISVVSKLVNSNKDESFIKKISIDNNQLCQSSNSKIDNYSISNYVSDREKITDVDTNLIKELKKKLIDRGGVIH